MALDDRFLGPRIESYWVEVLDKDENRIDVLDGITDGPTGASGVTEGSVTWSASETVMGGCSLTILNPDLDWMNIRFRPWVLVNDARWPLGVYVPAAPDGSYSETGVSVSVTCLDKTTLLSTSMLQATLSVGINVNVMDAIAGLLRTRLSIPADQIALTPSAARLPTALTWPAGTSYLQVIDDLLAAASYDPVWCDNWGRFRSEPWVDPRTQQPMMVFADGEESIHSTAFMVSQDTSSVPNRVTCVSAGDDTRPSLTAVATNSDPNSPYSYQSRGMWIDAFYDVEATDQAALQATAQKKLVESESPPWAVSVSHAVVPIKGRDVVRFTSAGVDRLAWVNQWAIPSFKAGTLMTGQWAGVSS